MGNLTFELHAEPSSDRVEVEILIYNLDGDRESVLYADISPDEAVRWATRLLHAAEGETSAV